MEGPVSIEVRKQLLLDHRKVVLKNLEKLTKNLKEVDVKIAKYSSPDAVKVITAERNYVTMEKKKYDLIYPYPTKKGCAVNVSSQRNLFIISIHPFSRLP